MADSKNLSTRTLGIALVVAVALLTIGAVVAANVGKGDAPGGKQPATTSSRAAGDEAPAAANLDPTGADAARAEPEPDGPTDPRESVATAGAPADSGGEFATAPVALVDAPAEDAGMAQPSEAAAGEPAVDAGGLAAGDLAAATLAGANAELTDTAADDVPSQPAAAAAPQLDADGMITIHVSSVPPGARLTVDRRLQGRVPKDLKFKPGAGQVRMKFKLDGHRHKVRYVDPDVEQRVEVAMDPLRAGEKQDDDDDDDSESAEPEAEPPADAPKAKAEPPAVEPPTASDEPPEGLDFAE